VVWIKSDSRAFVPGAENVAVRDRFDDFTFILGDHRYRVPSPFAWFLSHRVSQFDSIDNTIGEIRTNVEDRDELLGRVLEAVRAGVINVDLGQRRTFGVIWVALGILELSGSVCSQRGDHLAMDFIFDRLCSLSATRCDISTEL
jgi:hypothetical protein